MTNKSEIISIVDKVNWDILTKYIIDWSQIIILEYPDTRKVWFLQGESQEFNGWLTGLKDSNYCTVNDDARSNCKRILDNFASIMEGYPEYIDQYSLEKMKNFILTTYPFSLISAGELDTLQSKEEIFNFCKIVKLPEYPDIEKIFWIPKEKYRSKPIDLEIVIDNLLWKSLYHSIIDLSNIVIQPDKEYSEKSTSYFLGFAKTNLSLIELLNNEGYTIRDFILEGRNLLLKLYDVINIKLDIELSIKNEKIEEYEIMKKFIEETYPLNQIALKTLPTEEAEVLLKDFLEGVPLIPSELVRKKERIDLTIGEQLKEFLDDVLKESPEAKINIALSKDIIESILDSRESISRLGLPRGDNIVKETGIEADIGQNFNLMFYPKGTVLSEESKATKRININGDIEIYKGILSNMLKNNPNTIIGDIKINEAKELKDVVDILLGIYPNIIVHINILEKDKEIIKNKVKSLDINKLKGEEIILRSDIGGIEISEEFQPIDIEEPGELNRLLIFHLGKINVCQ